MMTARLLFGGVLSMSARPGYDRFYKGFTDTPAQQSASSADQRLHDFYRALDFGFRFGLIR
jgi:hypothetical protein